MDFFLFLIAIFFGILALIIHIILHELGHLVFGLIKNYKFFAFGIGSYAFIRENGKIKVKKYKIGGAGGYCIMMPPEPVKDKKPYFWYFAGGVIFNIVISIIALILINFAPLGELILVFLFMLVGIGFYIVIINALPLKISIGTDGCTILSIYKNKQAYEYLHNSEIIGIKLLKGMRMKDIPQNLLTIPKDANFNNPIFANIKSAEANKYYDNMEYEKAEETYRSLLVKDIKLVTVQKKRNIMSNFIL